MKAYIFDVDGVLTDPTTKLPQEKVLDIISDKLENNELIAFNTGRSVEWTYEKVIKSTSSQMRDKNALTNLFISGEFGGTWLHFDKTGKMHIGIDEDIKTPDDLAQKAKTILDEYKLSMFQNNNEDKKKTMISSEMLTDYSLDKYHEDQDKLFKRWEELIKTLGLDTKYKVSKTMIGTDIMNVNVGKKFGTKRIFNWFKEKGVSVDQVELFGDSELDILMAEESFAEGVKTTFIFVGGSISNKYPFPIIETKSRFSEGTLEYLSKFD
jgi:hydroxymethylpyrimidine pyrophosphatase-like HAD family hydrolase